MERNSETCCLNGMLLNTTITPAFANKEMIFKDITIDKIDEIHKFLNKSKSVSCDYTIGGIYMWIDYFKYQYCIINDTLFIKGVAQDDMSKAAFSLPLGTMPVCHGVELVKRFCAGNNLQPEFSAIPEERIEEFRKLNPRSVIELSEWSDYIYSAESLATLKGNKYSKKRNHVNRFAAQYPEAVYSAISNDNIESVYECFERICETDAESPMALFEREQVWKILRNLIKFPFETGCLSVDGKVVAFTIGEILNNVLHIHIEKSLHEYSGVTETLNKMFAEDMTGKYGVEYINRQDDAGDDGLRKAKMSYHPVKLLKKYNVIF